MIDSMIIVTGARWVNVSVSASLLIAIIGTRWVGVGVSTGLLITVIEARCADIDVRLSIDTPAKRAIVGYSADKEVEVLIEEVAESIIVFAQFWNAFFESTNIRSKKCDKFFFNFSVIRSFFAASVYKYFFSIVLRS